MLAYYLMKIFIYFRKFDLTIYILRGSKGVGVTIESYGKVEISYIYVDNF